MYNLIEKITALYNMLQFKKIDFIAKKIDLVKSDHFTFVYLFYIMNRSIKFNLNKLILTYLIPKIYFLNDFIIVLSKVKGIIDKIGRKNDNSY